MQDPNPAILGQGAGIHPGQVIIKGHTLTHTLKTRVNFNSPVSLKCMALVGGKKAQDRLAGR